MGTTTPGQRGHEHNGDEVLLRSPEVEPHLRIQFRAIIRTSIFQDTVLPLSRRYSQHILSPTQNKEFYFTKNSFNVIDSSN